MIRFVLLALLGLALNGCAIGPTKAPDCEGPYTPINPSAAGSQDETRSRT
jgi:hypothetical protein